MRRIIACIAAGLLLSACATTQRIDAAGDVHAFLISVRDNDGSSFNRYVDRKAIASSLEARLIGEANRAEASREVKVAAATLAGPAANLVTQTLVRPSVFRLVAFNLGYTPDKPIPSQLNIASGLRYVDGGRVCAAQSRKDPCLLTFAREEGTWRLVSIDAPVRDLKL